MAHQTLDNIVHLCLISAFTLQQSLFLWFYGYIYSGVITPWRAAAGSQNKSIRIYNPGGWMKSSAGKWLVVGARPLNILGVQTRPTLTEGRFKPGSY